MIQYHAQVLNKNGIGVVEDFGYLDEAEVEAFLEDAKNQYPGHPVLVDEVAL